MPTEKTMEVDEISKNNLLPVTLLCGFLGAGKTTLLKHVLETKHSEENFKCAVIVNDMASLNIDKTLIDQSALIQSDEVIAMQNGCFCCTLQNDLVEQIIELAQKGIFNYMLIEASGVSEPSQIAPLFDLCKNDHDHETEHKEGPELGEVARLDTCVTVVDAAEFYSNLDGMKAYNEGTIAELMMEQVEFSNVVVLNKQDLVTKNQLSDIMDRISLINPKAKIVHSRQSKINIMDILNTRLYTKTDQDAVPSGSAINSSAKVSQFLEAFKSSDIEMSCCKTSLAQDGKLCCKSEAKNMGILDSGLSLVQLGSSPTANKSEMTRHEKRFGITSFLYQSRRPFHPERLYNQFIKEYFMPYSIQDEIPADKDESNQEQGTTDDFQSRNDTSKLSDEELINLEKLQKQALLKQNKRKQFMGELLRSKGFIWIATSNTYIGGWQQAGNIHRVEVAGEWSEGKGDETSKITVSNNTNEKENMPFVSYAGKRQELVFIGMNLKHKDIQTALDQCLLNDEEMKMKHDKWDDFMDAEEKIQCALPVQLLFRPEEIIYVKRTE